MIREFVAAKRGQLIITGILVIFYSVGIAGHSFDATLPMMMALTPVILLVFGASVFTAESLGAGRKFLFWAAGTYIVTLALEILGVATGAVFGDYVYGKTLGLKFLEVPLVIGFNWMVIVLGCTNAALALVRRRFPAVLLAASMATLFDVFLEPVAIALDYWTWAGGDIPLQNYAAWFSIAFVSAAAFVYLKPGRRTWLPSIYVAIQLVFFILLRFII
jgi:putative membrane protein